jgi:hypothetical protein
MKKFLEKNKEFLALVGQSFVVVLLVVSVLCGVALLLVAIWAIVVQWF